MIYVYSVNVTPSNVSIKVGEWYYGANATVSPSNATNKNVKWHSSNTSVASVNEETGIIYGRGVGTATIYATAKDGTGLRDSCTVTVTSSKVYVDTVTLSRTSLSLRKGGSYTLTATVCPTNATNKTLDWSSDAPSIATVDDDGTVRAVSVGSTYINACSTDGSGIIDSCYISVYNPTTYVECVNLKPTSISMNVGEIYSLSATVCPTDATNKTLAWSSDNYDIATVDDYGNVCAVAPGMTYINACSTDGNGAMDSCCVMVYDPTVYVECVKLQPTSISMNVGETYALSATVCPTDATNKTLAWSSDNEEIATVDDYGNVCAVASGMTYINACSTDGNGAMDSCCVMVYDPTVYVECVKLQPTSISMNVGETYALSATVCPTDATNKTLAWSSDNEEIATVDDYGNVCAVASGMTYINACSTDGNGAMDSCCVMVYDPTVYVECVKLQPTSISMNVGEIYSLSATVCPTDATNKTLAWSSDNYDVATVDDYGNVCAVAPGMTYINACSTDGNGAMDSCCVTVIGDIPVESVAVNLESMLMNIGTSAMLTATISPNNATDKTVKWSSSNKNIATVNEESGVVTAVDEGQAVITVTTNDGNMADACIVTVRRFVESITVEPSSISLKEGDTYTLTSTVLPDNATIREVRWSSQNTNVATVNAETGAITAVGAGGTKIYATATDGSGIKGFCTVGVDGYIPAKSIDITGVRILQGESTKLAATVYPTDANDKIVRWDSNDSKIAIVGPYSGEVFAIKKGITTITASHDEINKPAEFNVEVYDIPVDTVTITADSDVVIKGKTLQLKATVCPDNASNKDVTWESSKESVATVDEDGLVHAIYPGTTVITAVADGGETDEITIRVVLDVVTVDSFFGYNIVTFESTQEKWHCIDEDIIYDEANVDNTELNNRSWKNVMVNPLSNDPNLKDETKRRYTDAQLKLLYSIDPFGVASYIQKYADTNGFVEYEDIVGYGYFIEEDDFAEYDDFEKAIKYKDKMFRALFGRDPKYFTQNHEGAWVETDDTTPIKTNLSESESLFGMHNYRDNKELWGELVDILDDILQTAVLYVIEEVDIIAHFKGAKTLKNICKFLIFLHNSSQEGFLYTVKQNLADSASEAVFNATLEGTNVDWIYDVITKFSDIYSALKEINKTENYYREIIMPAVENTNYEIMLKYIDGQEYKLRDYYKGLA